jgi:predicted NBD/HSP70 family sugar kinase
VRVAKDPVVLAVNPEIDAITAAVVGLAGRVELRIRRSVTTPTPAEATRVIAELAAELRERVPAERRFVGIGLAIPGLVRSSDGVVRLAPHLDWREEPFTDAVSEATGLPASARNDAGLGALAEHLFGIGRGVDELVYLNGGASGIGGGVVVRGRLLTGAHGYAGEFGHNRPGVGSLDDRATEHGELEDEVSRARLLRVAGLAGADEPELRAALLTSTDGAVRDELARQQRLLAVALSNAINVFNPELVVLGGFLSTLLAWDGEALVRAVQASALPAAFEGVRIRAAGLAEDRLLIGAAELAFDRILRDPALIESAS